MARKNFSLLAAERADAREALDILKSAGWEGEGLLCQAARLAVGKAAGSKLCALEEAVVLFIKDCLRRKLRDRSVGFYEGKLGAFAEAYPEASLDAFERPDVRAWLDALPVSDTTREGYRRALRALFAWARKQDPPLCRVDPTEGLSLGVVRSDREVGIFSPEEAEAVMRSAGSYTACAALMLFAGVRPSEVSAKEKPPLLWRHVDFKHRTLRIEGAIAKTRVARVLENLPPNLWQWLRAVRGEPAQRVCGVQARFLSRWAQEHGLARWPQDVCRHSFATYHIAAFGSVERTSLILGHEGKPRLLHQRYRGLATSAEAKRFFAIAP